MNAPTLDAVRQRLNRMERELWWWKALASVTLGILSLLVVMGAAGPQVAEEVRAKRFVLVDTSGKERAWLGVEADGAWGLALLDKDGKERASLGVGPDDRPSLLLLDKGREVWARLGLSEDLGAALNLQSRDGSSAVFSVGTEETGFSLYGKDRLPRARLFVPPDNISTNFFLYAKNGGSGAGLSVSSEGWSGFSLMDKSKKPRIELNLAPDGSSSLNFLDQNQRRRAALGIVTGTPALFLNDEDGRNRVNLMVRPDGSSLNVYDLKAETRVGLEAGDGTSGLALTDKDGQNRVTLRLRSGQDGETVALALSDKAMRGLIGLTVLPEGSPVLLIEKEGKRIWSVP